MCILYLIDIVNSGNILKISLVRVIASEMENQVENRGEEAFYPI